MALQESPLDKNKYVASSKYGGRGSSPESRPRQKVGRILTPIAITRFHFLTYMLAQNST